MMLYVFHVEVGRMMRFDMTVALSSVENLKALIERLHGIPAANIVLLVSGGEMLTQATQVAYYSAGTDTNPIYMFVTGEFSIPPPSSQIEPDFDLREQVERSLSLPANYETVSSRAQLALRIYELGRDLERFYESLVHEQHLQQQGWSAVIANLEDLSNAIRARFLKFCTYFDRHLQDRPHYVELLSNFSEDLTKLECIPILPGLMQTAQQDFHGFDEFLEAPNEQQQSVVMRLDASPDENTAVLEVANNDNNDNKTTTTNNVEGVTEMDTEATCSNANDKSSSSTSPNKKLKMGTETNEEQAVVVSTSQTSVTSNSARRCSLNLLQWITSKENQNTLKRMSDECVTGLNKFGPLDYESVKNDAARITKMSAANEIREIKGLGDRLCKLDEFKYRIKSMVNEQKENSSAFQNNLLRANNLRDPSVLPDLCASHQSQLRVMLQNHLKVREHGRLIIKAKNELGTNLTARLKHIISVENSMSEFDNRLLFYHRCLQRAERHIHIIEQIHQAPCIYVAAVTEVVRRKLFSGEFRLWATKLAEDFDSIHNEEIKRRQTFNASFKGHFLNILFPGMGDMPPTFANEVPLIFDTRLPNITKSDIDMLSSQLPDLASYIELPDMGHVIKFFVSRSGEHQLQRLEQLLRKQQQVTADTSDKPLQHQRLSELQKEAAAGAGTAAAGGEDSETDTETEFEKLPISAVQTVATSTSENQNPETMARSTTTEHLLMQSAETLTEENESTARLELERLRKVLNEMSRLSMDCIRMARTNLNSFRVDTLTYRDDLQSELQMLNDKWSLIRMQCEASQHQMETKNAEHNCEIELMRETLQQRVEDMDKLQSEQTNEMEVMQSKCVKLESEVQMLQHQLDEEKLATEKAVMEARQTLIHEHKTEIESLRCRFKLMTSMEQRSPSDTSLEKIERPTSAAAAADTADNVMIEVSQHDAIMTQLRNDLEAEKERAICAAVEAERLKILSLNSESVMANVSILKEMLEDKERQLEQLRERDLMVTKENIQLKTRLDALTNDEGSSWLKDKVDYLNRDNRRLEDELKNEKIRCLEMERSCVALRSSMHEQQQGMLQRSRSNAGSSHRPYAVLESCSKGDIVFVVWSVRHSQFLVVQDSSSLHFVQAESLAGIGLRIPPTIGRDQYYSIGRVEDKEYCQARKDENRYRVTKGSKFYRIKLSPLITRPSTRRERFESFSASISRSVSQSESHSESSAAAAIPPAVVSSTIVLPSDSDNLHRSQSARVAFKDIVSLTAITTTNAAANTTTTITTGAGGGGGGLDESMFKERTISETSVAEEDDEPLSFLTRYISVSEEDDLTALAAPVAAAVDDDQMTATTTTTTLQQTVITEQPTSSSKLPLNLMLASADIIPSPLQQQQQEQQLQQQQQQQQDEDESALTPTTSTTTGSQQQATQESAGGGDVGDEPIATVAISIPSALIPTSICTASEDSDEYRSLEAKDDTDFTISE